MSCFHPRQVPSHERESRLVLMTQGSSHWKIPSDVDIVEGPADKSARVALEEKYLDVKSLLENAKFVVVPDPYSHMTLPGEEVLSLADMSPARAAMVRAIILMTMSIANSCLLASVLLSQWRKAYPGFWPEKRDKDYLLGGKWPLASE